MVASNLLTLALAIASVSASPCPFGQLYEEGKLDKRDADNFESVRRGGDAAAEAMMHFSSKRSDRNAEFENEFYKRQQSAGLLPLGGGLLNGVLQPFKGALAKLELPVPQTFSLALIPDAAHPFVKPEKSAVRGMCPTLNTMANHGYINRNGITTFAQAANACQITLGFGYDTCVFLSALGLLAGGDLPTGIYSIGGADPRVPNTIGPALGSSHHGPFEIDGSISRIDTYFGNNADFNLKRYNSIKAITKKYGNQFNIQTWAEERTLRYNQDKATNPEYDAGPKQFAVGLAERVFIYRALPNGTALGIADYKNVDPFYLNETFPNNWFRRPTAYGLQDVGVDVVELFAMSPTTIPGYNQGIGNFIPSDVNVADLSPEAFQCFLLVNLLDLVPGQFSTGIASHIPMTDAFMHGAILPFFAGKGCTYDYTKPGGTVGTTSTGESTGNNYLVNGKYQPGS